VENEVENDNSNEEEIIQEEEREVEEHKMIPPQRSTRALQPLTRLRDFIIYKV
jgi:hypothetical protein